MEGYRKFSIIVLCLTAINGVTPTIKEGLNIPEKIIGGVIDIVQSHKNKPTQGQQPTYQYPQYQQWNGQSNYQGQGFQPQPQYQGQGQQFQSQGQYSNYQGSNNNFPQNGNSYPQTGNSNNFPQGGNNNFPPNGNNFPQGGTNFPQNMNNYGSTSSSNFASNQGYPVGSGQTFNQGQSQGQYQGAYQSNNQLGQPNNQYQNTQTGYYTQSQSNNQYQGQSTNTGNGQYTGQPGFVGQGTGNGQTTQGFYVNGVPQNGQNPQGPTCVCQAWTKPPQDQTQQVYADQPVPEKNEKKEEPPKERMF